MGTKYAKTIRLVFILLILLIGVGFYLVLTRQTPLPEEEISVETETWVEDPDTIVIPLEKEAVATAEQSEVSEQAGKVGGTQLNTEEGILTDYGGGYATEAIVYGMEQGYLFESEPGKFFPKKNIQRFEFIHMINRAFAFQEEAEVHFVDVKKEDFFYRDVCIAMHKNYLYTFNGNRFGPYKYFYRWELPYILGRLTQQKVSGETLDTLDNFSDSLQVPKNAQGYVELFLKKGWMKPESASKFGSKSILKKEEVAYTLYQLKLSGVLQ